MYKIPGPAVFAGLPDLRDESKDNTIWKDLPVPCWHVSSLYNVNKVVTYRMVKEGNVDSVYIFGRRAIRLGSLTQTARCQYIEHLFCEKISVYNILHRAKLLMEALDITRQGLKMLFDGDVIKREYMPSGAPRYPHWGLPPEMQKVIAEYIQKQLTQNETDESESPVG